MKHFFGTTLGRVVVISLVALCVVIVFVVKNAGSADAGRELGDMAGQQDTTPASAEPANGTTQQEDAQELPVFLEFGADWCTFCKQMQPVLEELKEDYDGRITFEYVDIDEQPELFTAYGGSGVPYYILIDAEGTPVLSFSGATTKEVLYDFIREGLGIKA